MTGLLPLPEPALMVARKEEAATVFQYQRSLHEAVKASLDIGRYISSTVESASAVSLSSGSPANLTSMLLTPGDWDVTAHGIFLPGATTVVSSIIVSLNTTSATIPTSYADGSRFQMVFPGSFTPVAEVMGIVGPFRVNVTVDTTLYCPVRASFTTSTLSVYGTMRARRAAPL